MAPGAVSGAAGSVKPQKRLEDHQRKQDGCQEQQEKGAHR